MSKAANIERKRKEINRGKPLRAVIYYLNIKKNTRKKKKKNHPFKKAILSPE